MEFVVHCVSAKFYAKMIFTSQEKTDKYFKIKDTELASAENTRSFIDSRQPHNTFL